MQCPNCETENRDGSKFCNECGFPLSGASASSSSVDSFSDGLPLSVSDSSPKKDDDAVLSKPAAKRITIHDTSVQIPDLSDKLFDDFSDESLDEFFDNNFDDTTSENISEEIQESPDSVVTQVIASPTSIYHEEEEPFSDDGDKEWNEVNPTAEDFESMTKLTEDDFSGFNAQQTEERLDFFESTSLESDSFSAQNVQDNGYTLQLPLVKDGNNTASKDFRIASEQPKRPSKVIFAIIGVIVVAVVAAVITFALGLWGGVSVPDVTGMTENDARIKLEDCGFFVRSTQVKSDDTEGLVLVMDPPGGARAAEGSEIVIHVATARFVPDIVGKNYDEAAQLLNEAGYENVTYNKVKSTDSENVILSVSPEAGTRAKSSMEIVVSVSEAYRVPDISELDIDAAEQAIIDNDLVPQVEYVDTQEYPEGTIIGTTPEANTKVAEGDYVSIMVARPRGTELVALTQQMLSPGSTITVGGTNLAVDSVGSINYLGDNIVAFQVTGRPFANLMGETVYGSSQNIEGQVVWSDDNEVISIS